MYKVLKYLFINFILIAYNIKCMTCEWYYFTPAVSTCR